MYTYTHFTFSRTRKNNRFTPLVETWNRASRADSTSRLPPGVNEGVG